jgi:hypothetical protein
MNLTTMLFLFYILGIQNHPTNGWQLDTPGKLGRCEILKRTPKCFSGTAISPLSNFNESLNLSQPDRHIAAF